MSFLRKRIAYNMTARGEILRAATMLLSYKASHGAFPEQLSAAIFPEPTDPFDRKPLKYRREGTGFIVYAVGRNHRLKGGKANSQIASSEAGLRYLQPTSSK